LTVARKRPRQALSPTRQEAGSIKALFDTLAKVAGPHQPYHDVVKERDALHSLFEQAPGFMALLDGPEHRYLFSNAANNRLLGRGDLVGKTVAEAFPELVAEGLIEILDRVYATGEPYIGNGLAFDSRGNPGAEAQRRVVNLVYQPIRAAAGAPVTGIFVEGHDVTDQYEAQARIQAQHVELIHVSRVSAMGTMASTVAHELNQPLTAISNYLSAASRIAGRDETDPRLASCLASAQEASLRAGQILRLLRDMTLSAIEISPVFAVDEAVQQAVELARASHPDMVAVFDIAAGATAKVDRIQFQQVMLNLIRNAQEACGDRPCRLCIKVAAAGPFLDISLADNGTGFAEDDLPNVFEALVTTKPLGMGVGLSVCRTIIETYGGRISANNGPDGGAIVRFTIPAG
jgi:two-component system sensor kinase FixL